MVCTRNFPSSSFPISFRLQCILVYKAVNALIPPTGPYEFVMRLNQSRGFNGTYRLPLHRLTVTNHGLGNKLPERRNSLPLRNARTLANFRVRLKRLLLEKQAAEI